MLGNLHVRFGVGVGVQFPGLHHENKILREKLGPKRFILNKFQKMRLAAKAKALHRNTLGQVATLFSPDTLLRWHRELIARKYDGSANRNPKGGRPRVSQEIIDLILWFKQDNKGWGSRKIHGYLKYLGYKVSRSAVQQVLKDYGYEHDPERRYNTTWNEFIRAHMDVICGTDFFSVELATPRGLVRYFVMFVIELSTRRVKIAGITNQPTAAWTKQIARNLTDYEDGFLKGKRYLIHDRDPVFNKGFQEVIESAGVECIKIPARSPNLNSHAERFVLGIKSECLNRLILTSPRQLEYAVNQYVSYHNKERIHCGIGGLVTPRINRSDGEIYCIERLGGLLKSYHRRAA